MNEQLRLVALSREPFEEEIDDGAHAGADLLRQAHDIGVAGEIGERPRIEEDRLDILRRQMKDEAARSRQRMLRHARRETRRELRERGAAGPEGEMGGGSGGRRLPRAQKGLSDARDQIDALWRKWRRKLLARRIELRQQRTLIILGLMRAGAVSEHVGHGHVLTLESAAFTANRHCEERSDEAIQRSRGAYDHWIASLSLAMTRLSHAAITSLQPLSSVFGARPTTRIALPKRPPAPASIVSTTPMSSVSTLWPG